jgi:hypothetical protein
LCERTRIVCSNRTALCVSGMSTQVVVRISDAGWQWSGQFDINAANTDSDSSDNEVCLRLRNTTDNTTLFLQVQASFHYYHIVVSCCHIGLSVSIALSC